VGRKALLSIVVLALSACGGEEPTTGPTTDDQASSTSALGGGEKPPAEGAEVLSAEAVRELERFAAEAPGEVGIAVAPLDDSAPATVGAAQSGRAWSTMKVPLLVALIDRLGGAEELSAGERSQAEAALTASDNEAALALFDRLGGLEGGNEEASAAIERVLRRAGDDETEVNTEPSPEGYSTFGQTEWSASASTRFFRALSAGCLMAGEDTDYVLSLMEDVVADQRWGLGEAAAPATAEVAFKGGWGPEPEGGYLVRQGGVVTSADRGYSLSVIAVPADTSEASFAAGQDLVTEAARIVAENAGAGPPAAITCER
jgi:beta-lactamase class A